MEDEHGHIWYHTDEFKALDATINFSAKHLANLMQAKSDFQWCVIGSTMALQGALIYQLHGHDTSGTAYLSDRSAKRTLKAIDEQTYDNFPTQRLETPKELLKKVISSTELTKNFASAWDDTDVENCKMIIDFRNDFIHFIPQSMCIDLSGFSEVFASCWNVISDLLAAPILYSHRIEAVLLSTLQANSKKILQDLESHTF